MPDMFGKRLLGFVLSLELGESSCALDSSCTFSIVLKEAFVVFVVLGILGLCTLCNSRPLPSRYNSLTNSS